MKVGQIEVKSSELLECIEWLKENNHTDEDINSSQISSTILFTAVEQNKIKHLPFLIGLGASPTKSIEYKQQSTTFIHWIVNNTNQNDFEIIIDMLVLLEINLDQINPDNVTPYVYAILSNQYACTEYLLRSGANPLLSAGLNSNIDETYKKLIGFYVNLIQNSVQYPIEEALTISMLLDEPEMFIYFLNLAEDNESKEILYMKVLDDALRIENSAFATIIYDKWLKFNFHDQNEISYNAACLKAISNEDAEVLTYIIKYVLEFDFKQAKEIFFEANSLYDKSKLTHFLTMLKDYKNISFEDFYNDININSNTQALLGILRNNFDFKADITVTNKTHLDLLAAVKWLKQYEKSIPIRFKNHQDSSNNIQFMSLDRIIHELTCENKIHLIIPVVLLKPNEKLTESQLAVQLKLLQCQINEYKELFCNPIQYDYKFVDPYQAVYKAINQQIGILHKQPKLMSLTSASDLKKLIIDAAKTGLNQPKVKRWLTLYTNYILRNSTHILLQEDLIQSGLEDLDYVLQLISDLLQINIEIYHKNKIVLIFIPKTLNIYPVTIQIERQDNTFRSISTLSLLEIRTIFGFEQPITNEPDIADEDDIHELPMQNKNNPQIKTAISIKELILGLRNKTDYSKVHNLNTCQLELIQAAKWLERFKKSIPVRYKYLMSKKEHENTNFSSIDNIIGELQNEGKFHLILPILMLEISSGLTNEQLNIKFKFFRSQLISYAELLRDPIDPNEGFCDIYQAIYRAVQCQAVGIDTPTVIQVQQGADLYSIMLQLASEDVNLPGKKNWFKTKIDSFFRVQPDTSLRDLLNSTKLEHISYVLQLTADYLKLNIEVYRENEKKLLFISRASTHSSLTLQLEFRINRFRAVNLISLKQMTEIFDFNQLNDSNKQNLLEPISIELAEDKPPPDDDSELILDEESVYLERLPMPLEELTSHYNGINAELIILLNNLTYHIDFANAKFIGEILDKIYMLATLLEHIVYETEAVDANINAQFQNTWHQLKKTYLQQLDLVLHVKSATNVESFNPGEDLKHLVCKILAIIIDQNHIQSINPLYQDGLKLRFNKLNMLDLSLKNIESYLQEPEPEPPTDYESVEMESKFLEDWFESRSSRIETSYDEYCSKIEEYNSEMSKINSEINEIIDKIENTVQLQRAFEYQSKQAIVEYNTLQTCIRQLKKDKEYLLSIIRETQDQYDSLNYQVSQTHNSWHNYNDNYNYNAGKYNELVATARSLPFGNNPELMGYSRHPGASLYGTERYEQLMNSASEYQNAAYQAQDNMDYILQLNQNYIAARDELLDEVQILQQQLTEIDDVLNSVLYSSDSQAISNAVINTSQELQTNSHSLKGLRERLASLKVQKQPQIKALQNKIDQQQIELQNIIQDRDTFFTEYNRKREKIDEKYTSIQQILNKFYDKLEAKDEAFSESHAQAIQYVAQIRRTILERKFCQESYIAAMKQNYDLLEEMEEGILKIQKKYQPSSRKSSTAFNFRSFKPLLTNAISEGATSKNHTNAHKLKTINKPQIAKFIPESIIKPIYSSVFFKSDFSYNFTSKNFKYSNDAARDIQSLFSQKTPIHEQRYYIVTRPVFLLASINLDHIVAQYTQTNTPLFCKQPFSGIFTTEMSSKEKGELLERLIKAHLQKMGLSTDWHTKINGNQGIDIVAARYRADGLGIHKIYVVEVKFSKDGYPYLSKRKGEKINGQILDVKQMNDIWYQRTLNRMKTYAPKNRLDKIKLEKTLALLTAHKNNVSFMGVSSDMRGTLDYLNLSRQIRQAVTASKAKQLEIIKHAQNTSKETLLKMSIHSGNHVSSSTLRTPVYHYHYTEKQRTSWNQARKFESEHLKRVTNKILSMASFRITKTNLATSFQQKTISRSNISNKIQSMQRQFQKRSITYKKSHVTKVSPRTMQTNLSSRLQYIRQSILRINRLRTNIVARINTARMRIQNVRTSIATRQRQVQSNRQSTRPRVTTRNRAARPNKMYQH